MTMRPRGARAPPRRASLRALPRARTAHSQRLPTTRKRIERAAAGGTRVPGEQRHRGALRPGQHAMCRVVPWWCSGKTLATGDVHRNLPRRPPSRTDRTFELHKDGGAGTDDGGAREADPQGRDRALHAGGQQGRAGQGGRGLQRAARGGEANGQDAEADPPRHGHGRPQTRRARPPQRAFSASRTFPPARTRDAPPA